MAADLIDRTLRGQKTRSVIETHVKGFLLLFGLAGMASWMVSMAMCRPVAPRMLCCADMDTSKYGNGTKAEGLVG